ncbi:DNA-binding protein [Vagococcus sp.]|uniref:DNA-binding protein n=1 Tax=Vagococcus sp. TaxID=1933889 RepID=UPI0010D3835C|nr:DNA-binding protein [Listeria monocytogenes]EAD4369288.1 DNA-binding protein [Listeria monocytogenes]
MNNHNNPPILLNREQAANFLGIDPKSFDKYVRSSIELNRFMIGRQERFLAEDLILFIRNHSILKQAKNID